MDLGRKIEINCKLRGQNCIGSNVIIGDNCELWVGAKIIGPCKLGNNITIGAGAVVVDSFEEDNIILLVIPAKNMKKILQKYNCKQKEEKIRLFFLIVIFLSMLNYWYAGDTNSTTRHGIELWNALFSGRFFQFYKVCEEAANEKDLCWHCAYYGMFIYS